jgi:hypothetical protein
MTATRFDVWFKLNNGPFDAETMQQECKVIQRGAEYTFKASKQK